MSLDNFIVKSPVADVAAWPVDAAGDAATVTEDTSIKSYGTKSLSVEKTGTTQGYVALVKAAAESWADEDTLGLDVYVPTAGVLAVLGTAQAISVALYSSATEYARYAVPASSLVVGWTFLKWALATPTAKTAAYDSAAVQSIEIRADTVAVDSVFAGLRFNLLRTWTFDNEIYQDANRPQYYSELDIQKGSTDINSCESIIGAYPYGDASYPTTISNNCKNGAKAVSWNKAGTGASSGVSLYLLPSVSAYDTEYIPAIVDTSVAYAWGVKYTADAEPPAATPAWTLLGTDHASAGSSVLTIISCAAHQNAYRIAPTAPASGQSLWGYSRAKVEAAASATEGHIAARR